VSAAVDETRAIATSLGIRADVLTGEAETACWAAHATRLFDGTDTLVRLSWLPANLAAATDALADASGYAPIALAGRVAVGAGVVSLDGPADAQAAAIGSLRRASALGHVVLMRAHQDVRALVDPWGSEPTSARLWAPLKRAWDPTGVLGASRGPL
jgi:FAD/FMN-containing dehydrogenase